MATDLNTVVVHGRLTADASHKQFNDAHLASFTVAFNHGVKKNGEWTEEVNFIDADLWGKRGIGLNKYLIKGTEVTIQGRLKQERWKAEDGSGRSKMKIVINELQLGKVAGQNQYNAQQGNVPAPAQTEFPY